MGSAHVMVLSDLVVQRALVTSHQVDEAVARQGIYGGDFSTSLLELVALDEAIVTQLAAESFGLPPVPAGKLPLPDTNARALISAPMASRRQIVPLSLTDDVLTLAVVEPFAPQALEDFAFTLGVEVKVQIALPIRIQEALHHAYGLPLDKRAERLIARLAGAKTRSSNAPPNLVDSPPTLANFPVLPRRASKPPLPVMSLPSKAMSPKQPGLVRRDGRAPPRAQRRHRGPLTLEEARERLIGTFDRDGLLDLAFEFARQYFDYCVLFVVQADLAEGRDAYGIGATRERVVGVGVPLDFPSVLASARSTGRVVNVVPSTEGLDPLLLADLDRPHRGKVVVIPVVVRTRVVALILGDHDEIEVDLAVVAEVLDFVSQVGKAFERLIARKKLGGINAVPSPLRAGATPKGASLRPLREEFLTSRPPSAHLESEQDEDDGIDDLFDGFSWDLPAGENADPPVDILGIPPPKPVKRTAVAVSVAVADPYPALVDRIVSRGEDAQAEAELLQGGELAVQALMARFPGPISRDESFQGPSSSRPSDLGPVLRILARQKQTALPYVLEKVRGADAEARYWATFLLSEFAAPETLPDLVTRLFDEDERACRAARLAIRAVAKVAATGTVEALAAIFRSRTAPSIRRVATLELLSDLRLSEAIPAFLEVLGDAEEAVRHAAHDAVVILTCQDFGFESAAWETWRRANGGRHRMEWLIDALNHPKVLYRGAAFEELKSLSKEYFGYSESNPERDRIRAQQRYRAWWDTEGRIRFRG